MSNLRVSSMICGRIRQLAMRLLKFPLLGRYALDWHWPRTADRGVWEPLRIASRSGASLACLYGAGSGERRGVVVCVHPLRRDAKGFFLSNGRAAMLRRNGYDVLLFDFNGFGASSHGDFKYVDDVLAAGNYARGRAANLPVHALALCFGAVWTLCAVAHDHPFEGIVVEAPLTSLHEYYAGDRFGQTLLRLFWRLFPRTAADAVPIEAVAKLAGNSRLLVIGGVEDVVAPIEMSRRLLAACGLPHWARSLWCVAGATHLRAFETAPAEYEARVTGFLRAAAERSETPVRAKATGSRREGVVLGSGRDVGVGHRAIPPVVDAPRLL
jgi:pimeloyl-ACP methyl ester carboxylesterase